MQAAVEPRKENLQKRKRRKAECGTIFCAVENPAQQIWVSTSFEADRLGLSPECESAYLHFPDCFEQLALVLTALDLYPQLPHICHISPPARLLGKNVSAMVNWLCLFSCSLLL